MGWGIAEGEFMGLSEMVKKFDIGHVNPSPAAIDFAKLDYFSGAHIRNLGNDDIAMRIKPYFEKEGYRVDNEKLIQIIPVIRERLVTWDDALYFASFFFKDTIEPSLSDLIGKNLTTSESKEVLQRIFEILKTINDISPSIAEPPLRILVDEMGLKPGQVFGILRAAVTGQSVSPPLFESMEIIGIEKVLERIRKAIEILSEEKE